MSDCGCIYTGYDGQTNEFEHREVRTSRKVYKCCECHDVIQKGTKYQRDTIKSDGSIQSYTTCLPCAEIRESLCCDGWVYTQLYESAAESIFENFHSGCLSNLTTAAAKEKLVDEWKRWRDLP